MRLKLVVILLGGGLALSGCAASLAASAVGAAVRSAQGQPQSNESSKPVATQACAARAAQHGTVHIIDVEQRTTSKLVVWGTATNGAVRQSFECTYTTRITGFRLRAIKA